LAWAGIAAAAITLLLATTMVLSAGARHTACRTPGLRSLCGLLGLGPSPEEQAMWNAALTQPSCDGLRAYLRTYPAPSGAYVEEATSRLSGRLTVTTEALGPEREDRFPLAVRLTDPPLPTEHDARHDALTRGNEDAVTTCKPLGMKAQIVSAHAEDHRWTCSKLGDRYACAFDGEVVCRVRDRVVTETERCNL
jgi:hypothetical protein